VYFSILSPFFTTFVSDGIQTPTSKDVPILSWSMMFGLVHGMVLHVGSRVTGFGV
jgi:hypothetical protein